jgi:hypothetical protein
MRQLEVASVVLLAQQSAMRSVGVMERLSVVL